MPWHFYFQKDNWRKFTDDGNKKMNEALSQDPVPEEVKFTHRYGKNHTTEYTVNFVSMQQRQKSGAIFPVQAYWDDNYSMPFVWEKAKEGNWPDKEKQESPQADGAAVADAVMDLESLRNSGAGGVGCGQRIRKRCVFLCETGGEGCRGVCVQDG